MEMTLQRLGISSIRSLFGSFVMPMGILMLVAMMVLPLPSYLLDTFFVTNILLSLLILMVAMHTRGQRTSSISTGPATRHARLPSSAHVTRCSTAEAMARHLGSQSPSSPPPTSLYSPRVRTTTTARPAIILTR